MPQLTIGPEYFRKERDIAYSNWAEALPREFVQNSIDAGATTLNIAFLGVVGHPERLRIIVTDNGTGMSRDTLDNVFFRLGASTKDADGTQGGGFGRARIMTHFAAEHYEIVTRDLHVVGRASEYNYVPSEGFVQGCQMVIDVLPKSKWGYDVDVKKHFIDYLKTCDLRARIDGNDRTPLEVVVDGERHTEWTRKYKILKPLSLDNKTFGHLYVNKSAISKDASEGILLIRVNGMMMFTRSITPKVQVIFEIDPTICRDVLQSSRDSMNWQYRSVLDSFIDDLNTETKSALRTEEKESRPISGTGSFVAYRENATAKLSNRDNGQRIAAAHSVLPDNVEVELDRNVARTDDSGFDLREIASRPNVTVNDITDEVAKGRLPSVFDDEEDALGETESDEQEETADEASEDAQCVSELPEAPVEAPKANAPIVLDQAARNSLFDVLIFTDMGEYTDAEKKAVRAVIGAYNPLNWKVGYRKSQATAKNPTGVFFEGLQRAKLLLIWKTICHHVVQEALHYFDMEKISWGVGWNFDSDGAKHHTYEGVDFLLLNPVDRAGKMQYELRDQDDLDTLFALAVHEVCHVKHKRHDEDYAQAITGLFARCLKRLPAIKRGIRDVYKVRMI